MKMYAEKAFQCKHLGDIMEVVKQKNIKSKAKKKQINIRVREYMYDAWQDYANRNDKSLTQCIKDAMNLQIVQQKQVSRLMKVDTSDPDRFMDDIEKLRAQTPKREMPELDDWIKVRSLWQCRLCGKKVKGQAKRFHSCIQ